MVIYFALVIVASYSIHKLNESPEAAIEERLFNDPIDSLIE